MQTRIRSGLLALVLTAIALLVSALLFQNVHPLGGINLELGRDRIIERAGAIADSLGVGRRELVASVDIKRSDNTLRQVYERFGVKEGNVLLRTKVRAFSWMVVWERPEDVNITVGSSGNSREEVRRVAASIGGRARVGLDFHGGLTEFEVSVPDSERLPSLSSTDARARAEMFMARYPAWLKSAPGFHFIEEKRIELPLRTDFEFSWGGKDSVLDNPFTAKVRIAGNRVAGFNVTWETPPALQGSGERVYYQVTVIVLFVVLIVAMIVMALKRIRTYEIGWRTGLILGIASAIMMAIQIYFTLPRGLDLSFLLPLLLGPVFYGGALVLTWSVAESVGRETWKEKFLSIDLLTRGHFLDSRVGGAVLMGLALGAGANAVWTLGVWLVGFLRPVWFRFESEPALSLLSTVSPGLILFASRFAMSLFSISAFIIFPMALLKRRIASAPLLIGVVALALSLINEPVVQPLFPGFLVGAAFFAVILWSMFRYDALTAFAALVVAGTLRPLAILLSSGDQSLLFSGEVLLGILGTSFVLGWIGVLTRDRVTDTDAIAPAFARFITERERLQQELQIAREVQLSLLPKTTPRVEGLEIASRCVPALEVGGDYYDFVQLVDGRLGIVVGDVSGKGTEGAFYMTLTKGFLKAVTRASDSPAAVLIQANSLFYENVERGNFISIIYSLLDLKAQTVTLARAGHNPAILHRAGSNSSEALQPRGIALGLEPGEVFSKTIEEVTLPFRRGDMLVLYTDGFGEAMNIKGEQFGDARLLSTVTDLAGRSADDVLNGILAVVKSFAGKAVQNDDMTIVVIRSV